MVTIKQGININSEKMAKPLSLGGAKHTITQTSIAAQQIAITIVAINQDFFRF
jgi:hypothetical protein